MSDFDHQLQIEANELCRTQPSMSGKLMALAHAGFRAWAKAGNLSFPPEKRYALLQEVLHYCASECLLACCYCQHYRLSQIADMLDASYPRYARTRAKMAERRNRNGRPQF